MAKVLSTPVIPEDMLQCGQVSWLLAESMIGPPWNDYDFFWGAHASDQPLGESVPDRFSGLERYQLVCHDPEKTAQSSLGPSQRRQAVRGDNFRKTGFDCDQPADRRSEIAFVFKSLHGSV